MAQICYKCGKKAMAGHLVSHSKIHTKRRFKPNLHIFWVFVKGKNVRAKFCTKCLRTVKGRSHRDLKLKAEVVALTV